MNKKILFRRLLFSLIIGLCAVIMVMGAFEGRDFSFYLKALLPTAAGILGLASTFYTSLDKQKTDQMKHDFQEAASNHFDGCPKAKKLFYKGYRAWYGDHYDAAYHYLKKAVKAAEAGRAKARVLFLIGRIAVEEKKTGRAIEYLKYALEEDPSYDMAWSNLATIYFDSGQPGEAVKCCENAIFYNPRNAFAYNKLGGYYFKTSDYEKAVPLFERALKELPQHPVLRMNYAHALSMAGRRQEALKNYQAALNAGYRDPNQEILAVLEENLAMAGRLSRESDPAMAEEA